MRKSLPSRSGRGEVRGVGARQRSAAQRLGPHRPQGVAGLGHDRHAQPLGGRQQVEASVGEGHADVGLARALGLDLPAGGVLELLCPNVKPIDDHVTIVGATPGPCRESWSGVWSRTGRDEPGE